MRFDTALPVRRPQTIRARIAAADDDDSLSLGGDRLVRNGNSRRALILLSQVFHRQMHALELTARNRQITGLLRTHGQPHRIELRSQLFARDVFPNRHTGLELDALGFHLFQPTVDDPLFHFEIGNAIAQQAADAIGLLEERDAMTRARQLLRCRHTRRTRPDNGDGLPCLDDGHHRFDVTFVEATIDDIPLDDANRDRVFVDAEHAGPFARRWTEPTGKLREVIRGMERLKRVFPAATIDEIVPVGDQVDDWTAGVTLAKRHTAVHAAGALRLELVFGDGFIHLLPIEHAQLDRFPLGALTGIFHETFDITHFLSRRSSSRLSRNDSRFTLICVAAAFFFRSSKTRL